ncbi:MAG TPA: S41 family peptidase [Acidisarcina sp.]
MSGRVAGAPQPAAGARRWLQTLALGIATLALVCAVCFFALLEFVAHRPARVPVNLTAAEIQAEDARLKTLGLTLADGSFLSEHPFQPPWTSHSLLIPGQAPEPGIKKLLGSKDVRADQLLSDLDVLEAVMQRAYGGWDTAAARGWDWSGWFADWRRQLAVRGRDRLSLDEAFAPVDKLIAFQRDNHTRIPLLRRSTEDGSQTATLDEIPRSPCTQIRAGGRTFAISENDAAQQVRAARVWRTGAGSLGEARYVSMPASFGSPEAVRCGDRSIGLRALSKRTGLTRSWLRLAIGELWSRMTTRAVHSQADLARVERLGGGVVYARLPTFASSNYEGVSRESWARRQPSDRVLIVDLRNNGGGDEGYGLGALEGWVDEARMRPEHDLGMQVNASCLAGPLRWNALQGPGHASTEALQSLLDGMARPYPAGCPRAMQTRKAQWTYGQRRFAPAGGALRIVALVNSSCASDCELITARLASLPETLVAGTNTFGMGRFIQPGYSVLPLTGLRYRISTGVSDLYGDDRSVDGYGLDVDIVLPDVDSLTTGELRELGRVVELVRSSLR